MYYIENTDWHTIVLNSKETDVFFEAFNLADEEIPSYLINAGWRFIRDDAYQWLLDNVGVANVDWRHQGTRTSREFLFRDKEKAMLFKLTFHGT
jgi:hypothetical protein